MSSIRPQDMSSRHLRDMSSRRLEEVCSMIIFQVTSLRRLRRRKIVTLKTFQRPRHVLQPNKVEELANRLVNVYNEDTDDLRKYFRGTYIDMYQRNAPRQ